MWEEGCPLEHLMAVQTLQAELESACGLVIDGDRKLCIGSLLGEPPRVVICHLTSITMLMRPLRSLFLMTIMAAKDTIWENNIGGSLLTPPKQSTLPISLQQQDVIWQETALPWLWEQWRSSTLEFSP